MLKKIIDSEHFEERFWVHTLEDLTLLSGVKIDLVDEETQSLEFAEEKISSFLKELPQNLIFRIYFNSEISKDSLASHSRAKDIVEIGSIKNSLYFFIEEPPKVFGSISNILKKTASSKSLKIFDYIQFESFSNLGLKMTSLDKTQVNDMFSFFKGEAKFNFQSVDLGLQVGSIIRLTKQTEHLIDIKTLSHLKDQLPLPYLVSVNVKTISQVRSEALLRKRSKQNENSPDLKENRKLAEAQTDLESVSLGGGRLLEFEWQLLLLRKKEEWLRVDRDNIARALRPLGEAYIESVGLRNSFLSVFPGSAPHFTLIEKDDVLPSYFPVITRGSRESNHQIQPRSLAVHRQDESISYLDIFDTKYESFSWCIFGRPGTGKSVLVNAITRALANDPNIQIIKIDVGGSHSRETKMLGGVEKTLSLNEPTGINPFLILNELGTTKECLQILGSFLEVLILEEGEVKLSKSLKSDLERLIQFYSDLKPQDPSLEDFYNQIGDLPRKNLLGRWVDSGVYGNAFAASGVSKQRPTNLLYYNFSKISQAQDPDYAQGGLAAVMAEFNFQMLRKSEHKKRIVFIADETPFFIQKCFNFFNLSIANIRKEGHGFITVAQKSAHVVVGGDTGILDNSPNKVFFSSDGDDESFLAKTQLSPEALEKIKSLQRRQGEFSEAFVKDAHGERVVRIRLSKREYWSYTSKDEDKRKFEELSVACPSLSTEEVIRCLSSSVS